MLGFIAFILVSKQSRIIKKMQHESAAAEAKLKFLERAAQTYARKAPALSAHIMLQRAAVAGELGMKDSGHDRQDVCQACGTFSIPGVTSKTTINGGRRPKKTQKVPKRKNHADLQKSIQPMKSLETTCLSCFRVFKVAIRPSKRENLEGHQNRRTPTKSKTPMMTGTDDTSSTKTLVPNNSTKRGKSRKKGGLQALVERSKESQQSTPAFGLDLMDFMKEG